MHRASRQDGAAKAPPRTIGPMEALMHNVNIQTDDNKLVIEIDTSAKAVKAASLSSIKKTKLLASTGGAIPVEATVAGLKVALNVMIPPTA